MGASNVKMALALALLMAAGGGLLWQQGQIKKLRAEAVLDQLQAAEVEKLRSEVKKLPSSNSGATNREVQALQAANEDLRQEVLRLRGRVSAANTATARARTEVAAVTASQESNAVPSALSGMVRGAVEQQIMGKLPLLKSKLRLSDQQEAAIREIMTRQVDQAVEASQKMLAGKMTRADMTSLQKNTGNPEEQIKALLTPEQLPLYQEYKTEESASNARLVANAELIQMQGSLGLSQEQQDQVFKALYEHTLSQFSGNMMQNMPKTGDAAALVQWQLDQKVKALESVLNPEQLDKYRELQASQAKMIMGLMPKDNPPAGNPAP